MTEEINITLNYLTQLISVPVFSLLLNAYTACFANRFIKDILLIRGYEVLKLTFLF